MSITQKSFIEVQFPVSKLSKESYTERKANKSQTLTGLGRWWGRKPLSLVRAVILGLLLPATANPRKDREIFLKLMTMDEEGLWRRRDKNLPASELYPRLEADEQLEWFDQSRLPGETKLRKGLTEAQKEILQRLAFSRLSFDEKMEYCSRPEEVAGPSASAWQEINAHLNTHAQSLTELVTELGQRHFGHLPRVGDAFCGGGSVPFEAARLGCDVFASDLNPVAALLTWAGLNIVGGGSEVVEQVRQVQQTLYTEVNRQITEWRIEHNEKGWRASTYFYCLEATCPACGWRVPLSATWLIVPNFKVIAVLKPNPARKGFDILIETGVSEAAMKAAQEETPTVREDYMCCPNPKCQVQTSIAMLRGDNRPGGGLRRWENTDLVPRPDDTFGERLYCIRWIETVYNKEGKPSHVRHFLAPDEHDHRREARVLELLQERFTEWQAKGYIPSRRIDEGDKTNEPIRTRGWTYWHHLFNPRQLLYTGLFSLLSEKTDNAEANLLLTGKMANFSARLSRWHARASCVVDVFSNQALNTLYNYSCRGFGTPQKVLLEIQSVEPLASKATVKTGDCRAIEAESDIWITDPPYADAINYHELSEFFLAWYEKKLPRLFPDWYTDSKRALAVSGSPEVFRRSMVECYRNLARHMPDNGMQVVMFTHQDAAVWADLALILWASGLSVTAAWCIVTETNSALKEGNYVQGTVLLILRKQTSDEVAFLDEIHPQIETEVKEQLKSMLDLEDNEDPNFTDTDYQLAAYAAALRVLTRYRQIEDIDVTYELNKERRKGETSPVEALIDEAVRAAAEYLVPRRFDSYIWKRLRPEERFYLRGLDIAKNGEHRTGAYQELARGFGLKEYKYMLGSTKPNEAALKTATGFGTRNLDESSFGDSPTRHVLFAINEVVRTEDAQVGKNWLRAEVKEYWSQRKTLIEISRYFSALGYTIPEWKKDAEAARLLTGALENDHV